MKSEGKKMTEGRTWPAVPALVGMGALFFLLTLPVATPVPLQAQLTSNSGGAPITAPRVYIDCQGRVPCREDHFRTEIQFVNWARDRTDSDVHVIITSEEAGGSGRRYTLDFVGRMEMEHLSDQLTYTSQGSDVMQETLDGLARALWLGLQRFAVESGMGQDFDLRFTRELPEMADGGDMEAGSEAAFYDPWDYWIFRVGLSGNYSDEETRSERRLNPSFSADRVTETWKINLSGWSNLRRQRIELSDGREVRDNRDDWRVNALLVRSVTPHISTGVDVSGASSARNNQRARVTVAPAAEWNYYPYEEANRRQLIAHYGAGFQYSNYSEETVFGVTEQTIPLHKLGIQYRAVEPWGNASVGVDASQYLHEGGLYSIGASGNLSFRIARGLELSLRASAEKLADEIHIPAGNISDEDILLGRQALASGHEYEASIGFNYRWGSSFANIVNTRFPSSVR